MINTLLLTGGEIHDFNGAAEKIKLILDSSGQFKVTAVENDLEIFADGRLNEFELLVFYYTLGTLTNEQKNGLLSWVASGNGYVGVHSAADSFRGSPEYRAMVGGHFVTHPAYRDYQVSITDSENEITKGLTEFFTKDEQYILDYDLRVNVLASALHKGKAHPVAWTRSWGEKGKVFYLALGHDPASMVNPNFAQLLTNGAQWAGRK